jgi:hypothetical protein
LCAEALVEARVCPSARRVPMPAASVVRDRLVTGIAPGYSQRDWMAPSLLAAEKAASKPRKPGVGTLADRHPFDA